MKHAFDIDFWDLPLELYCGEGKWIEVDTSLEGVATCSSDGFVSVIKIQRPRSYLEIDVPWRDDDRGLTLEQMLAFRLARTIEKIYAEEIAAEVRNFEPRDVGYGHLQHERL